MTFGHVVMLVVFLAIFVPVGITISFFGDDPGKNTTLLLGSIGLTWALLLTIGVGYQAFISYRALAEVRSTTATAPIKHGGLPGWLFF